MGGEAPSKWATPNQMGRGTQPKNGRVPVEQEISQRRSSGVKNRDSTFSITALVLLDIRTPANGFK